MLTNCTHERDKNCIPSSVQICEGCTSFILDTDKCANFNDYSCMIETGECPCKNFKHKDE